MPITMYVYVLVIPSQSCAGSFSIVFLRFVSLAIVDVCLIHTHVVVDSMCYLTGNGWRGILGFCHDTQMEDIWISGKRIPLRLCRLYIAGHEIHDVDMIQDKRCKK